MVMGSRMQGEVVEQAGREGMVPVRIEGLCCMQDVEQGRARMEKSVGHPRRSGSAILSND